MAVLADCLADYSRLWLIQGIILLFPLTRIDATHPSLRNACSSANTNGVSTLNTGFADPDMEGTLK